MRDNAFAVARLLCGVIFVHRGRIFASSRHRIGPFSMEAAWGSRWVIETPHETVRAASPDLYKMPLISVVGIQGQNVMQNGLGVVGGDDFCEDSESGVRMPLISVVGDQGQNVMHNGLGVVGGNPPWTPGGPSSVRQ